MSEVTVVEVPQWQGSSSTTAMRLAEGSALLSAMIPEAERVRVEVGETLAETASRTRAAISRAQGRFVVTVGGDCGVELEPISAALRQHGDRLAVVWFDAHGDLNTPVSSPSGAFHGMVLCTLLGDGRPDLVPDRVLRPEQVFLAGVRALDPAESDFVRAEGIADLSALVEGAAVYLHIDLDVLEPDVFGSVGAPEPGGLLPAQLIDQVAALAERFEIVGLGLTEYEPARPEDHDLLAKMVPELVGLCRVSTARQIERRAARAWPTSIIEDHEGWLLRHSPGVTRRRWNSALPPIHHSADVDHIEAFYSERDELSRVQVSPAEHHRELDAFLAARGYRLEGTTSVLTARTKDVIAATRSSAPVETCNDRDSWPQIFGELDDHPDTAIVGRDVISRTASPAALLTVSNGGSIAGMGLIVPDSGWAGIFSMATHPEYRRRGIATAVLGACARWAAEQGADRLYLQVERGNKTARRLYDRVGFACSHSYHYRIHPGSRPVVSALDG